TPSSSFLFSSLSRPRSSTLFPYTTLFRSDVEDLDFSRDISFPGEFPYTRGIHPTGYRGKLWTMRQFAGFSTPEETNARFKYLLRSEEHTSELQSRRDLVCRLLLEKKNK